MAVLPATALDTQDQRQVKIYVINLARNSERLQSMERQLGSLGLVFERSAACDGYAMAAAKLKEAERVRPLGIWNTPGHIGCLFSHAKLWGQIAEGADAYACVMEDDVHISKTFAELLKREDSFPKNFDLIRFDYSPGRLLLRRAAVFTDADTGVGLYKLLSPSWGAAAYIISRACAKRMAEIPASEHRVADYLLFDFAESPVAGKFAIYQISPAVVVQDKNVTNEASKFHFASNLNDDIPPPAPPGTWDALKKGRFKYAWRTLRGYKPLPYVI